MNDEFDVYKIIFNNIFDKRTNTENFTKVFPAKIKTVGTGGNLGKADITLIGDDINTIPNVKIKAGVVVNVGDVVYVQAINRNMNNLIIDFNPNTVGASGSFTSANGKTITVVNGLITSIV